MGFMAFKVKEWPLGGGLGGVFSTPPGLDAWQGLLNAIWCMLSLKTLPEYCKLHVILHFQMFC